MLLRFRLNPAAIVGDIHQAFLQLQLDENDRDLTRFFWYRVTRDDEGGYNIKHNRGSDLLPLHATALRPYLQPFSTFGVIAGTGHYA